MSYLSCEQVAVANTVKTVSDLTVPTNATHAELQASDNSINYTMDGATDPGAGTGLGMRLLITSEPKTFLIQDLKNIRFIHGSGDANLNIHYFGGRDI